MDDMLDLADLGDFLDSPGQHYSTGMRARLGFAVAVHGNPDLLLVDEVLAVGDLSFQNKCLRLVENFRQNGGAVVYVGHNPFQMQASCQRGIILDKGCIQFDGSIVSAIDLVLRGAESASPGDLKLYAKDQLPFQTNPDQNDAGDLPMFEVHHTAISYQLPSPGANHGSATIEFTLYAHRSQVRLNGLAAFFSQHGTHAIAVSISHAVVLSPGMQKLSMEVPSLPLLPGNYLVKLCLLDERNAFSLWNLGWSDKPLDFQIPGEGGFHSNIVKAISSQILFSSHMHVESSGTSAEHS